jgi:acyl-coenzyme A synthetase/AMP-(fatty) acid ligase/acyl carrier protein
VGCAVAELTGAAGAGDPDGATVPAGRPVTHARLAVLDPAGSLAPPGAVGELSIGGAALARGYAGAPAVTAAAFRPDPWSATPGARTYRSGDRMRWLPDAALEYLGRFDRQLKVRGHRVDPGEVEAAMLAADGVAAAAVRLAEGSTERLLGYLVPAPGSDPGAVLAAVTEALARQLPEHMLPSVIHSLPTLPMTASGKVDYAALPEWPSERVAAPVAGPATTSRPDPTSSEREREVARIWQEVLQVDRVGPDSDFFALGGHSLAAVRVVARLRETLQAQVRLHDLFAARTVSRLAARIDREA